MHVVCVAAQLGSRSVPHDVGPLLRRALGNKTLLALSCPAWGTAQSGGQLS